MLGARLIKTLGNSDETVDGLTDGTLLGCEVGDRLGMTLGC